MNSESLISPDEEGNAPEPGDFLDTSRIEEMALKAAEACRDVLSGNSGRFDSATGAMLLYQNLMATGYDSFVSVGDVRSAVRARCQVGTSPGSLSEEIKNILEDMVSMFSDLRTSGFTVEGIRVVNDGTHYFVDVSLLTD